VFHVANRLEAEETLRVAVRHLLAEEKRHAASDAQEIAEERIEDGRRVMGACVEHEQPPAWQAKVIATAEQIRRASESRHLIGDMMRLINWHMGEADSESFSAAKRLITQRVNLYFQGAMQGKDISPPSTALEVSEIHVRTVERLLRRQAELTDQRDRIAGEKSDLKARARRLALWVSVNAKHGPHGNGGPGPCDPDCIKCDAEKDG